MLNIIKVIIGLVAPEVAAFADLAKLLRMSPKLLKAKSIQAPAMVIKKIESLPTQHKKIFEEIIQGVIGDPKKVAKKLGELDAKGRKTFSELQQQATKVDETKRLSSSWILKGHFRSVSLGSGDLTIFTKGGSYTYPGVPLKVWIAMRKARGRNGSGAGSVFWALYLRGYKNSYTGQLVAKMGKLLGVKTPGTSMKSFFK